MEGHLGRLGHGPQQHGHENGRVERMLADVLVIGHPVAENQRAAGRFQQQYPHQQGQPAAARYQQGLFGIVAGFLRFMVEDDQQIGKDGGDFPEDEQQQQVVRHNDAQHGQHEGVQVDEKTAGVRMSGHVAGGEKGDQEADPGDDQAKQEAEAVQAKAQ